MSASLRAETRSMLVDIENVTGSSVDENGFLQVTIDVPGERGSTPHEVHHIGGLWHQPLDPVTDPNSGEPDPSQSGQALTLDEGGTAHAILLSNPKTIQTLPIGVKGETILFNDFGAFCRLNAKGEIWESTTTAGGAVTSSSFTVARALMPTGSTEYGPWGTITFNQQAWRLEHKASGAGLRVGTAAGIFPGLKSAIRASADMIDLRASSVTIGPPGSLVQPVAQAVPLVAVLSSIMTVFEALEVAMAAMPLPSGGQAVAAAIASPLAAAVAAVAGAIETISTQSAIG